MRADRAQYWLMLAVLAVIALVVVYLDSRAGGRAAFVGGAAAVVRHRQQDLGLRAWWIVVPFLLGGILAIWIGTQTAAMTFYAACLTALVVLGLIPGQPGHNRYGAPLAREPRYPN